MQALGSFHANYLMTEDVGPISELRALGKEAAKRHANDPWRGRVLGDRYRVLECIGSGGMGSVYRALDTDLGRQVSVKLMHPHLFGSRVARRRFQREVEASVFIGNSNTPRRTETLSLYLRDAERATGPFDRVVELECVENTDCAAAHALMTLSLP